ncbi:hypothetical protein [Actibacterium pelagium]|nr:hypothetical protein [Actibacterium pelagium]
MRQAEGLKDFAERLSTAERKRPGKYQKSKDVGANALPLLRGPQQELALLSVKLGGVKDVPNTEDNKAELERNEREIDTLADRLKDVEAPLRKWLAKKAEAGVNTMKTFIKTEDGQLVRTGGNESGGGHAKGRSKTNGVPQEYLDQLAVAVDVHQRFIEAGELDWEHYQALEDIRSEALKVKHHVDENLVNYQRCDHFLKMAREKLADKHYSYLTALRESFVHKVDTYEKLIETDPKEAHALLDALTTDLAKTEINQPFTDAGLEHKALEKLYNEIKSLLTKDYAPLLSKVVAEYETYLNSDSDEHLSRGFQNFLRRRRSYKGIYHSQVEEYWANYDTGSNNARKVLRSQLEPMKRTIREEIKALKLLDGKSAAGGSWGELSARATILERAVEDLGKSEAEIRDRSGLEKEYQQIYDSAQTQIDKYSFRLLAFWKRFGKKDRRMDKRVGDALSNHRVLLKALKSRSKTTKTVDQWKELIADAEKKRAQIERFIEANSIPRADGKPSNDQTAAADALKRCGVAIDKFKTDISDFAKKVEGERDKLDAIAGKRGSDAGDARKAVALIDKEIGKVKRFVEVFAKGFDGHGFDVLSKSIDEADSDKVMELRENAVAKLRRYRTHLTDSQLGRLYASNPFDEGARAVPLRLELIRAEGILNTKIKPS